MKKQTKKTNAFNLLSKILEKKLRSARISPEQWFCEDRDVDKIEDIMDDLGMKLSVRSEYSGGDYYTLVLFWSNKLKKNIELCADDFIPRAKNLYRELAEYFVELEFEGRNLEKRITIPV